jgi:drug/metabolite transporter (DMT)-like permease
MTTDKPLLGIFLMLCFCIVAPLSDGLSKLLGSRVPVAEIVMARFALQAIILLPVAWIKGKPLFPKGKTLSLIWIRAGLHVAGVFAMITALQFLPLADALAIAFVMPFIMLLLGWAFLGESIGPHRIGASVVGFVGTLLVIQPSFANVGWPAMLPLFVAVVFALFVMVTRMLAKSTDPIALQAASGLFALPMLAPLFVFGAIFDMPALGFETPSNGDTYLLFIVGVLGTIGHLFMTWSLRFAPSATLAPMQYLEIPFATLIGWLLFKDLPNGMAALGIGITIAAGLYIILREQATARGISKARA